MHGDFERDVVSFGAFGMSADSTLAPGGPLSNSGTLGSTRRETLGSRLGFLGFSVAWGPHFQSFLFSYDQ